MGHEAQQAELNASVKRWAKELQRAGIKNNASISELSDHYRSAILLHLDSGVDITTADSLTRKQLGSPEHLFQEFSKNAQSISTELPGDTRFSLLAFIPCLWFFLVSDVLENMLGRETNGSTIWMPVEPLLGILAMVAFSAMIINRVNSLRFLFTAINYGLMFLYGVMFLLMVISGIDGEPNAIWKLDSALFQTTGVYLAFTMTFGVLFAATIFVARALTRPYVAGLFQARQIARIDSD